MKKYYDNKQLLSQIIFFLLGSMFLHFLLLHPSEMSNGIHWITSFVLMLLFLYLVFVVSTLLQLVCIFLCKVFPIKVVSLSPITYDGKWRVHPLRLLYNIEGFSNSLIINLSAFVHDQHLLDKKMKQLLRIRKLCIILSFSILLVCFFPINFKTLLCFAIACIGTIALSFFRYGNFWYGYDAMYHLGMDEVTTYLYGAKSIMMFSAKDYANAFLTYDKEDAFQQLSIVENYLYRCIIETSSILTTSQISKVNIDIQDKSRRLSFDVNFDAKYVNFILLLGWTGMRCHCEEYIQYAIDLQSEVYETLVNNSSPFFIKYGVKKVKQDLEQLKTYRNDKRCPFKLQDMQTIYRSYDQVCS